MKYHLLRLLFIAVMLSRHALATILVNTGGIHQHSSNAYSTLLSRLRSTTTEAPTTAAAAGSTGGSGTNAAGGSGPNISDLVSLIPTLIPSLTIPPISVGVGGSGSGGGGSAGGGGGGIFDKPPKDLSGLSLSGSIKLKELIRATNQQGLADTRTSPYALSQLAEIIANTYNNGPLYNSNNPYYGYNQYYDQVAYPEQYLDPAAAQFAYDPYGAYGQYSGPYPAVGAQLYPDSYPAVGAQQPYGYGQYSDPYSGSSGGGYSNYYANNYPYQFYRR